MKKFYLLALVAAVSATATAQIADPTIVKGKYHFEAIKASPVLNTGGYSRRESKSDWFDPAYATFTYLSLPQNGSFFRSPLFPDSSMLVQYSDGSGGTVLGEVGTHSVGLWFDPRSLRFQDNPFMLTKFNTYTVDSVAMLYLYDRSNPDANIKDSLIISTFLGSDGLIYQSKAWGTVAYDRAKNTAKGQANSTVETFYKELGPADTSTARWGELAFPLNRTVTWNNAGRNFFGLTFSFIPGNKNYPKTAPFDTLDSRGLNVFRKHNIFSYQFLNDPTTFVETEDNATPFGMKILNNGLIILTTMRYGLTSPSLDDNYYGFSLTNGTTNFHRIPRVLFKVSTTSLSNLKVEKDGYGMGNVYPNPAAGNSNAALEFSLGKSGNVAIEVYDLAGKKVMTVANGIYNEGKNTVTFSTESLKAGVYSISVKADGFASSRSLVVQ